MIDRRWRARASVLVVTVAAALLPLGLPPATAGDVVIVDIPTTPREEPRGIELVAQTDTYGLMIRREADHDEVSWGRSEPWLLGRDGLDSLEADDLDAVGDRVVNGSYSQFSTILRSRLLSGSEEDQVALPDAYTLVDYTADGVLASGAPSLRLVPWDGGADVAVAGVPDGFYPESYDLPWTDVHDAHGSVIVVRNGSAIHRMYVDTSSARAWVLPETGTCDARVGTAFGIGPQALAWRSGDGSRICTLDRPTAAAPALSVVGQRAAPALPVEDQATQVSLLPVGSAVVASVKTIEGNQPATKQLPVLVVHADGSTTELLTWGHHVVPVDVDSVAVVGGDAPQSTVRLIDLPSRASTTLLQDDPVPSLTYNYSLDRGRLLTMEQTTTDFTRASKVVQYDVDPLDGTYLGRTLLSDQARGGPVAREGAAAWTEGTVWVRRDAQGTRTTGDLGSTYEGQVTDLTGPFLAVKGTSLVDTRSGRLTRAETWEGSSAPAFLDGVRYSPGSTTLNGPVDSVAVRDLETGDGTSIPVPGCVRVRQVQVAGAWLLAKCFPEGSDPGPDGYYLMDRRTGTTTTLPLTYNLKLGNGFLARIDGEGALQWALPEAPDSWQTIAVPGRGASFAPASGQVGALAWSDGHTNRVALLPVTTRSVPPLTFDVARPQQPQVSVTRASDSQLRVSWADPDPAEQITGYGVSGNGGSPILLPGTARSQVLNMNPDIRSDIRVVASSVAGNAATLTSHNFKPPPPAPTNVVATVDKSAQRARVSWDWAPGEGTQPITGFEVRVNNTSYSVGDERSTSGASTELYYGDLWTGRISVVATTAWEDSSPGWSNIVTFPGPDRVPPVVSVEMPAVTFREVVPRWSGTDDRGWFAFEVRHRESDGVGPLGPWQWWNVSQTEVSEPTWGSTHCFVVRGRDGSGNYSEWTEPACSSAVLDQRRFTRKGTWRKVNGTQFFQGFAMRATRGAPSLVVGRRSASEVWLVASTCSTCGSVRVKDSGGQAANVSLRSAKKRARAVVRVPWSQATSGTLTITRLRKAGAVTIDGIAYRAD